MSNVQINPLLYSDISSCADVFSMAFKAAWAKSWSLDSAVRRIQHLVHCPGVMAYTAKVDGKLAGFVIAIEEPWIFSPLCRVEELAVSVEFQRQGIGHSLINHLETICQHKNIPTIFLTTARGTNAEKFYRQMGFGESLMQHMAKSVG